MKLKPIQNSYLNVSGNVYDSEFINLAQIKDDKIAFDERVLFLSNKQKEKLNSQTIVHYPNAVYIFKKNNEYGLVADLDIDEYKDGKIKTHEMVFPSTIQGMIGNFHTYNAESAPTLLIHKNKVDLQTIVQQETYDDQFTIGEYTFYIYQDEKAIAILEKYEAITEMYVGDGHHRLSATAMSKFKKSAFACILNIDQMQIAPIHRVLANVDATMFEQAKKYLQDNNMYFEDIAFEKGVVRITYNDEVMFVKLNKIEDNLVGNQDVLGLNTQIFTGAFRGFCEGDVSYIGHDQLEQLHLKKDEVLFELIPITKEEFMEFSNLGYIMSPKSTWFSPKFPSFLIMKKYR